MRLEGTALIYFVCSDRSELRRSLVLLRKSGAGVQPEGETGCVRESSGTELMNGVKDSAHARGL